MSKFEIDLTEVSDRAMRRAKTQAETEISIAVARIVRNNFNEGRYGTKEGLAHEIIRKKIEEVILSDSFNQMIDKAINETMEEEVAKAVRCLINSKSRKVLFSATDPTKPENFTSLPTKTIIPEGVTSHTFHGTIAKL